MRTAISLLVALAAGCTSEEALYLGVPGGNDARSIVVAVERTPLEYVAADLETPLRVDLLPGESLMLRAVVLPDPLEELGLVAGDVVPSAEENARALPEDADYYASNVVDGAPGAWEPSYRAPSLAGFKLPPSEQLAENCLFAAPDRRGLPFRSFREPIELPDGRLLVSASPDYHLVDADGTTTLVTVTATRALTPLLADEEGIVFREIFGKLWHGVLDESGGAPSITPVPMPITPPISVDEIAPADRPGRYVVLTPDTAGILAGGRFVGTFDCDCSYLRTTRSSDGRVFVGVGINILELVDDRLEFRALTGGSVLGIHAAGDRGVFVLRRAGAESGALLRYDPSTLEVEELHSFGAEGPLVGSVLGRRGISYLVDYESLGGRVGAVYHYVPGYGSCGTAVFRAEAPLRAIARLGGEVVTLGGDQADELTYLRGPRGP